MANVIKYIYTSVPANTVQTYPFVIGVNFGGYGSTAATGYWNGKTPNVGAYTIYVDTTGGSGSPTIYVANNDTQLINLCNQLFGTGVSTVGAALQTFNGSTSTCCVNMDYPNIVTTNIGPNLDAGYTPSYPRTGTTWTDISGSLNNGTLINGVSYASDAFTFDGTDDAVTIPTITLGNGNWSVCMWISAGSFNADYGKLLSNNSGGPVSNALGVTSGKISYQYYLTSWNQQLGNTSLTAGPWYFLTWVNSSPGQMLMYVNGVVDCALFTSTTNNGGPVNSIGRNWFSTFPGKISTVSIYQGKSLTPAEILQNYYTGLQRFIPTGSLVLYLDGNNTNKQVMTASTANDISGNNYNGTLTNGVALARDGQRSFSFDGVDDYISLTGTISLGNTFTIISWIKLSVVGGTYNVYGCVANGSDNWFGVAGSVINFRGTEIADVNNFDLNGVTTLSVGVWYQIAVTVNVSTVTIYLNGVVENSVVKSFVIATWNSNGGNDIGRRGGINSNFFNGNVGQVRAYNTVLSTANILTIYTAGKQRYGL
jgi:hypothetical protein